MFITLLSRINVKGHVINNISIMKGYLNRLHVKALKKSLNEALRKKSCLSAASSFLLA